MSIKHITRDYSSHKKSVIRPYDEYVGVEIFSFNPKHTKMYLPEMGTLKKGVNSTYTSWKSWSCFKSADKQNDMVFTVDYNVVEDGEYRLDFIYEQSNHIFNNKKYDTGKNLVGHLKISNKNIVVYNNSVLFDGENNILKRKSFFNHLTQGKHVFEVSVPSNCYFMGVIVRKIINYTGNNYHGDNRGKDEGNINLKHAVLSISDMVKPSELQLEIDYDYLLESYDSPSGFYIDYMDECNFYVKDNDGQVKRVFGGYISSILPDDDRTKLKIHCADRLVDGQNKYILDEMILQGGTKSQSDDEYTDGMTKNFNSYAQALKYLCDIFEVTLKSNISKNFLVDGEKYSKGFTITYGKNKSIKKIPVSNGIVSPSNNFILLRNKSSGEKRQVWTLYDASKNAKKPPALYNKLGVNYGYMHITYGLGSPKISLESKVTENVDTSDVTAGSQKFNKCGVSKDKKYLMAIGKASAPGDTKKYPYKNYYKSIFVNKCPHCGKTGTLVWGIFWGDSESSDGGRMPCTGRNDTGAIGGNIFCKHCDSDYSVVSGKEHIKGSKYKLKKTTTTVKSSKKEAYKLKNGKMTAVPSSNISVSSDDVFNAISKLAFKYKYKRGASSSYSDMKKTGRGDCWAFSDLIYTELKKYGVSCKIVEYKTGSSNHHRSVLYKNDKNKWVDFPYREYGWGTKYNNVLNNTGGSKTGAKKVEFKGSTIGHVKVSKSTSKSQTTKVTTTKNYDKDKPFQGYLKVTYSNVPSFKCKKKSIYIKFTHDITVKNSINDGFLLYWVNNTVKRSTLSKDLVKYIHQVNNSDEDIYLQSIQMITPVKKPSSVNKSKGKSEDVDWYKYDNSTIDESSCKLRLYQISFNDNKESNPSELKSCGKTILSMIGELVKDTGYLVDMSYGKHRSDDKINFRVNNTSKESFTATEGDNNNILSWNSINYSPVGSLFNMSMQVFKKTDGLYYYTDSRYPKSILEYGEKCVLETNNQPISESEAYFNARMNTKYNPVQNYTFTITVPGFPDLRLFELVKVIANAKKLNTIKELKSIKLSFDYDKMPRVRTELGLGELSPDLQLKKNIRLLRENAKKESTSFSSSAIPVTEKSVYEWDK